ncbi:TATA box-binding protein-like protein 1 [Sitophilus oryzae]|uniref:TATA box-binding protein-like 1 n=1 Tax=Sitophilus oryzae TaxID=7048 RepID=A0A6J2XMS8_SITOR|nr:TATA box-binding protein-like protein 1 [Sitophilus oryzae]
MATAIQKNSIKTLSNGNGIAHHSVSHHSMQSFNNYDMIPKTEYKPSEIKDESFTNSTKYDSIDIKEESTNDLLTEEHFETSQSEPEIDIVINNVVCSFSVRCHLNLREIALNGMNVEYRKENGMITMKLRRPYTTASIWSSGKVTCTGATSEEAAKQAARKFARCLQKLGFNVKFNNYRVVNVLGTCSMPFAIRINSFSERHREADYEPELHPGVTYKLQQPKATLKIFSTGSVTVTAPSVAEVQAAIEYIFPLVYEFRKERSKEEIEMLAKKKMKQEIYSETHLKLTGVQEEQEMNTDEENWGD